MDQHFVDQMTREIVRTSGQATAYDELMLLARQEAAQRGQTVEQAFDDVLRREHALRAKYAAETRPEPEPDPLQTLAGYYHEALAKQARIDDPTLTEAQAFTTALDKLSPEFRKAFAGQANR